MPPSPARRGAHTVLVARGVGMVATVGGRQGHRARPLRACARPGESPCGGLANLGAPLAIARPIRLWGGLADLGPSPEASVPSSYCHRIGAQCVSGSTAVTLEHIDNATADGPRGTSDGPPRGLSARIKFPLSSEQISRILLALSIILCMHGAQHAHTVVGEV